MEATELILLYDYYGELLTDRQRECFELRYYQDLSLAEIGEELGISRQGAHDNLTRTEALLHRMEDKTGCVRRDRECRRETAKIKDLAEKIARFDINEISGLAEQILSCCRALEE